MIQIYTMLDVAKAAFRLAAYKLAIATKFIERGAAV